MAINAFITIAAYMYMSNKINNTLELTASECRPNRDLPFILNSLLWLYINFNTCLSFFVFNIRQIKTQNYC